MRTIKENIFVDALIKSILTLIFIVTYYFVLAIHSEKIDTTAIDSINQKLYNSARSNPNQSLTDAHKNLVISVSMNYKKGIADANLALAAAYLAKYNPNDSATFYYNQALANYIAQNDLTGQARACYGLSYTYSFKGNTEKATKYGALSVKYFEETGDKKSTITALGTVIYLAQQTRDYEKALNLSNKAIDIAREISDTLQLADAINNTGNIYKEMLLLNEAIDYYFRAFKLWELKNDSAGLAIAYGSVANAYFLQEDYKKSLEYNFKKLPLSRGKDNLWETCKTINNIALAYSNLNKHDSALFYMRQVLQIAKVMPPEEIAKSYDKIASAFIRIGKADSAFFYSSKAVLATEKNNSPAHASYLVTLANSLEIQKKYSSALENAKKAYNLAVKQRDAHTIRAAALLLSDIYYRINRRDLAYTYLSEYLQLNDSITNLEFMRKVTRLDIQHEYEKKQKDAVYEIEKGKQQIEILNKTNELKSEKIRLQWIILSAIILLSLAGASISFLIIKNKNYRIGKMSLELHNYLLRENEEAQKQNRTRKENTPQIFMENYGLTQREAEILEEISIGLKNNEIAQKLFVSENTVKFHIKNIYIKLDVKNRIQALQKANS